MKAETRPAVRDLTPLVDVGDLQVPSPARERRRLAQRGYRRVEVGATSRRSALAASGLLLAVLTLPLAAHAQRREPLCVPTEARRLLAGPSVPFTSGESIVVQSLRAPGAVRYIVAVPDAHQLHAPHAAESHAEHAQGLTVLRLDGALHTVGDPAWIADAPSSTPDARPAMPQGVTLADGVLVLERAPGGVFATVAGATGGIPPWHRVVDGDVEWFTLGARGNGAVALAGTHDGDVFAVRFDAHGAAQGTPSHWSRRVGGPMRLLPTEDGPLTALLGRPVQGSGPDGEQARVQVMVTLNDALEPVGDPTSTGFAQFPLAFASRPRALTILQWAQQQGVAIATLPVGEHRVGSAMPRVWYAQPPLEGTPAGHAATVVDGVVYDAVLYREAPGAVHGHVAWIPPSGTPVIRRDVIPLFGQLAAGPVILPADDGFALFTAIADETGSALDAYHVHCDLVNLPAE